MRIPYITLLAAGSLALGGCAANLGGLGVGVGYGSGYDRYGYGGYGGYGYYDPFYGGYGYGYNSRYRGYGYGYDDPWYGGYGYRSPFGWYGGYYYPGTGYYVYDRYRRPRTWSDAEQRYWMSRQSGTTSTVKSSTVSSEPNWSRFDQRTQLRTVRQRRDADGTVVPNQE